MKQRREFLSGKKLGLVFMVSIILMRKPCISHNLTIPNLCALTPGIPPIHIWQLSSMLAIIMGLHNSQPRLCSSMNQIKTPYFSFIFFVAYINPFEFTSRDSI